MGQNLHELLRYLFGMGIFEHVVRTGVYSDPLDVPDPQSLKKIEEFRKASRFLYAFLDDLVFSSLYVFFVKAHVSSDCAHTLGC